MLLSVVSMFVLLFVAAANGNCPDFVPTTKDTAQIAGQVYSLYYANDGIPATSLRIYRCSKKINTVNSYGTITSDFTYRDTETNDLKNYTVIQLPIDHNRARVTYVSTLSHDNALIRVLLDMDPDNYIIWAFCQTVDGKEGYALVINGRSQQMSKESLDAVKAFLKRSKLTDDLKPFDQENC